MPTKILKFTLILIPLVLIYTYFYYTGNTATPPKPTNDITTFEECKAAGYPIMESYPERCSVPGGGTFTRVTTDVVVPSPITISGIYTCLPKKDTGGPVTLECALGLKTDGGFYALDTSAILSDNYPVLTGNESITVEGYLVPIEMLSTNQFQTYDIIGIISVEKISINKKLD